MIVRSAMKVGENAIGWVGGFYRTENALTIAQLEAHSNMVQQATLALQLIRLSEAERRAAVLKEQTAATLAERSRLAREIHDTLAQGYVGILLQVQVLRNDLPADWHGAGQALNKVEELARKSLAEARRSIRALRPKDLARGGLSESMRRLVDHAHDMGISETCLQATTPLPSVPEAVQDELQRIAQEAVHNVIKHSQARKMTIVLEKLGDFDGIRLVVQDDGRGFDPQQVHGQESYGLRSMQERAQRVNASLTIVSEPGHGCLIVAVWSSDTLARINAQPSWGTAT